MQIVVQVILTVFVILVLDTSIVGQRPVNHLRTFALYPRGNVIWEKKVRVKLNPLLVQCSMNRYVDVIEKLMVINVWQMERELMYGMMVNVREGIIALMIIHVSIRTSIIASSHRDYVVKIATINEIIHI